MVFINGHKTIFIIAILLLTYGCSARKDFEFCFSTIVECDIAVSPVKIGDSYAPCGFLGSYAEIENNNYDFTKTIGHCGKMADGYRMEIPDSAWFEWGVAGVMHQKNLKMPSFPKLNPGEKYRVGFVIGYQDCVYVWINTVPKY